MRILTLGALFLLSAAQAQPTGVPLSCAAASRPELIGLPTDGSDLVLDIRSGPAWLEIEEAGQRVIVADAPPDAITVPQPLRFGWHWLPVDAGMKLAVRRSVAQSRATGAIKSTLHCAPTAKVLARIDWLRRAGAIGASIDKPVAAGAFAQSLATVRALVDDAPSQLERAIALHFVAEAFGANSRGGDAVSAFALAEQAWSALGDHERALAARLGRIEELRSTDSYQAVLDQTPDVSTLRGRQTYFSTRLENPRCLSLQAVGRLDDAAVCFDWLLGNYRALDERDDYIVAAQNFAGLQRDRGHLREAEEIGLRSLELTGGPNAPMLRGRLHLMIADIAMRGGSVARAFTYAQQALGEFDSAQFGVAPWRASALMFTAILYSQLGANGEAFGALAEAVGIIAPLGMPSRMALAMNIFADIETNLHHDTSALWWRRVAEETYSRLNMAPAYQATRAVRLGMQARRGEVADVRRELATLSGGDPLHAAGPLLLAAELAVREGRLDEARAALDQANRTPLSLRDQIRIAVIEAQQHARSGDAESAQHVLRAAAMRVDALAQHAGYAALRYVIARQALALRQTAFELVLDSPASPATINAVEAIWPWLVQSENTRTGSSAQSMGLSAAEPFDRAVAAELLSQPGRPPLPSDVSAQRALLSLLAQPASADTAQSAASTPPLAAFQRQLDADTAVIAYVDGSTRGALLWVTREDARLVAAAPPDQVRASALALREQVRSAAAPIAELRATAQQLSAQLLGAAPAAHAPARLFVIAADPLDGIAWSVLPWPGGSEALVESTAVSLVHLATETEHAGHAAARMPDQLHVVVAAQAHAGDTPLRSLSVASVEAAQIRQALGEDPLRVDENAHASARAVLDMLGEPAAWVHVAAHGTARPLRIGYAGIWLEPPAPDATPAFLSWLDVLDNGVRADLIVLDACQLGDSGSAVSGNLSFADAVARAGARRVIAALWPVSDAASALWVPEFYRALVGDPHHDAAQALRAAQLRLRATRAFTHPFFWAGMQSIERLPLAPGPSAAHVKPGG